MREFDILIEKPLLSGLRQFGQTQRNVGGLEKLVGIVPRENGLVAYDTLSKPGTDSLLDPDWPFPQIFVLRSVIVLITKTGFYEVSSNWTSFTLKLSHASTDRYHCADFGDYVVFAGPDGVIKRDALTGTFSLHVADSTMPVFETACNYKGQLIAGNVTSSWHDCSTGHIIWSDIGSADFTITNKNEAGYIELPGGSDVLCVKRLGNYIIVYGENEVVALQAVIEPVPSFGIVELANFGPVTRNAVSGDNQEHCFIDTAGDLWKLDSDLKITKVGYKEYFSSLISNDVIISLDPRKRDYYIGSYDGDPSGYILTQFGLAECFQAFTSVFIDSGALYGVAEESSSKYAELLIGIYDMGSRGLKTLQVLEFGAEATNDLYGYVSYRNDTTSSFSTTDPVILNPNGIVTIPTAGVEFKLGFYSTSFDELKLSNIRIRYKLTDKRSIRGKYASQITTKSSELPLGSY